MKNITAAPMRPATPARPNQRKTTRKNRLLVSPSTVARVERFGETWHFPGITDALETVEANPSHQVNHSIA
jgi:hypothetical protein